MAASQSYLKWGRCPQTPGIFIEGIESKNGSFRKCKTGHFYFALTKSMILKPEISWERFIGILLKMVDKSRLEAKRKSCIDNSFGLA